MVYLSVKFIYRIKIKQYLNMIGFDFSPFNK